jgi:UPF0271 protein
VDPDVDLNADVGEAPFGKERGVFSAVTSVNVCCGFHAGDPQTSRKALVEARRRRLRAGAHPGYPDRETKGRRPLEMSSGEIRNLVRHQLRELAGIAEEVGIRLAYAKPHGALYTQAAKDARIALAVAHGIQTTFLDLAVMAPAGSHLERQARLLGLAVIREGFADRRLDRDGTLVPRGRPGAVIEDPGAAARQALAIAPGVDSICVHADTPGAARIARAVRLALGPREEIG